MEKIVKFIDLDVPITNCNLKCHYCYVAINGDRDQKKSFFKYSPEYIGKALTKERLGGVCHFNMCGHGETLIPKEVPEIARNILKNGHYLMIVTNGLLTKRIEETIAVSEDERKRLGFKFSFHFLELKRTNQMELFFENAKLVQNAGCSISIEMTPSDEAEQYIPEIKQVMMEKMGALCHITIPRNGSNGLIELLSKHTLEEFCDVWGTFDSALMRFKKSTWGKKRCEFCYAGAWSGLLNLGDGEMYSCYGSRIHTNAFKNLNKPIKFTAVGAHCTQAHCYNSHSFLTYGLIPELDDLGLTYADMRDRTDRNGAWLTEEMRNSMSQKLYDNNPIFSDKEKKYVDRIFKIWKYRAILQRVPDKIKYEIERRR